MSNITTTERRVLCRGATQGRREAARSHEGYDLRANGKPIAVDATQIAAFDAGRCEALVRCTEALAHARNRLEVIPHD